MANGGRRPGAGRKKGSTNRPQLRDFYTPSELKDFIDDLKLRAKTDSNIAKFVAEQIFGKAVQPIGNADDEPFKIQNVEVTFRHTPNRS